MRRCLALLVVLLACAAPARPADTFTLTILHTNDFHGMMLPFDYDAQAERLPGTRGKLGGMARRAALIARLRSEIKNPLLVVDAGDVFTRGPWHKRWYGVPEIEAMNRMGYDLLCVGNNELKATGDTSSQAKMQDLLRRSRFPWVAANLVVQGSGKPVEGVRPFVVRRFGRVRVGLLGLTGAQANGYRQIAGWRVEDPVAAAQRWVPLARKECDVLVAVVHLDPLVERQLAAQVPGIDAIVGGHYHTLIAEPILVKNPAGVNVPIVQAGERGVVLGRLDLAFERRDGWRLASAKEHLLPLTQDLPEDPAIKRLLDSYLNRPGPAPAPAPAPAM